MESGKEKGRARRKSAEEDSQKERKKNRQMKTNPTDRKNTCTKEREAMEKHIEQG